MRNYRLKSLTGHVLALANIIHMPAIADVLTPRYIILGSQQETVCRFYPLHRARLRILMQGGNDTFCFLPVEDGTVFGRSIPPDAGCRQLLGPGHANNPDFGVLKNLQNIIDKAAVDYVGILMQIDLVAGIGLLHGSVVG